MENEKKTEAVCKYCKSSQAHARRHGNESSGVVCKAHRDLNWLSSNGYNPGNVSWRNPQSAWGYHVVNYGWYRAVSEPDEKVPYIVMMKPTI